MDAPHRRRSVPWRVLLLLPPALLVGLAVLVHGHFHIAVPERLPGPARRAAVAAIRAALQEQPVAPGHPALLRALPQGGPVVVGFWHQGRELARAEGRGASVAAALAVAGRALARAPAVCGLPPGARRSGRIKVDLVVGRGPLAPGPLRGLSLDPGLEGLVVALALPGAGRELVLLPEDLVERGLVTAGRPLAAIPDVRLGLDLEGTDRLLAARAGLSAAVYRQAARRYLRVRTDSFVEPASAGAEPLPLSRGQPPPPRLDRSAAREAALAGGRYLVRQLTPRGRYIYERGLHGGEVSDPASGPYSLPRHAGTTYFLAELLRLTGAVEFRPAVERALEHLADLIAAGGCRGRSRAGRPYLCVVDRGEVTAQLGSSALAVVAFAEYERATGDRRHRATMEQLAEWLLEMQRPDGSFAHLFDVPTRRPDPVTQLLYYAGEAALALARMHQVSGEARHLQAAERALDQLVGWYDFFLGRFFHGEEHWTCLAAEAAWPALKHRRYLDFCLGFAAFLRSHQFTAGELPERDGWAGAYGFTPFVVPQNTPAGSRTEAMLSTYQLSVAHGRPATEVAAQIAAALQFALRQQVRADNDWAVVGGAALHGAVPASAVDPTVRIDYVQHLGSALVRGAAILPAF
jgi:hypothetical protein